MWRRKAFKILIFALGAAFAVGTFFYTWLSYGPSGYSEFEAENAEAMVKADAIIAHSLPTLPSVDQVTQFLPPSAELPESPKVDFQESIEELDRTLADLLEAGIPSLANFPPGFVDVPAPRGAIQANRSDLNADPPVFELGEKDKKKLLNGAAKQLAIERSRFDQGREESAAESEVIGTSSENLSSALDLTEQLLLQANWTIPEFEQFDLGTGKNVNQGFRELNQGLIKLGGLAIVRATLRNEAEKASLLLTRCLQAALVNDIGNFPEGRYDIGRFSEGRYSRRNSWTDIAGLLSFLGEMEAFPLEGLRKAKTILDEAHLSTERFEGLRTAHAMRAAKQAVEGLENQTLPKTRDYQAWYSQYLSRAGYSLFKPMAVRSAEKAAIAYAQGDWDRLMKHQIFRGTVLEEGMNVIDTPMPPRRLLPHRSSLNKNIEFASIVLAVTIVRRETGGFPRSVKELPSGRLGAWLNGSPDHQWVLVSVPARSVPLPPSRSGGRGRRDANRGIQDPNAAFFEAVKKYEAEHGESPSSAYDLRPYAGEAAEGMQDLFFEIEETPIIVRIGFDLDNPVPSNERWDQSEADKLVYVWGEGQAPLLPVYVEADWEWLRE